jgi:hypothetical protein
MEEWNTSAGLTTRVGKMGDMAIFPEVLSFYLPGSSETSGKIERIHIIAVQLTSYAAPKSF